jgi:hypothetical protein
MLGLGWVEFGIVPNPRLDRFGLIRGHSSRHDSLFQVVLDTSGNGLLLGTGLDDLGISEIWYLGLW